MTNNATDNLNIEELLNAVQQSLIGAGQSEQNLQAASRDLSSLSDGAHDASQMELSEGAAMLARVTDLAAIWSSQFPDDVDMAEQLIHFVREHLPILQKVARSAGDEHSEIEGFIRAASEKWNNYLELLDDLKQQENGWDTNSDTPQYDEFNNEFNQEAKDSFNEEALDECVDEFDGAIGSQIEMLLSAVSESSDLSSVEVPADAPVRSADRYNLADADFNDAGPIDLADDRELLEAYLDDAVRCLSSMEQAALALEKSPAVREPAQNFCRELHTLKGASATVGLSDLASYLHNLETQLEEVFANESTPIEVELLFAAIDRVRAEIGNLQPAAAPCSAAELESNGHLASESPPTKNKFANLASNEESSIRIRAAKLDRLMDMLAELVVLRNRRESHVAEFNQFNEELSRCALRLKFAEEQQRCDMDDEGSLNYGLADSRGGSSTFSEVGKDISAVSLGLRELQKPVSHDNAAISRFIRDFRQELMQLRRIPVSGLFQRLQRAARDAAKTEQKKVQFNIVGENAGLEQEIQERLFESLLHVVRNSVSHGVESAEKRIQSGKNPIGTVTLEAYSSAQLLVIEVRDDGNGLDYVAVRKRAIEKGLLTPNYKPTQEELSSLIFHPGFSTREQASEVSGRGVGMDIVAKTIDQLHGRIEIESVAGKGTTIRLLIPLRSGIEHVMVFRSNEQLYALPLQSVTAAKSSNANIGIVARLPFSSAHHTTDPNDIVADDVLVLRQANELRNGEDDEKSSKPVSRLALAVDEMVGPEEVVVRRLPKLLQKHPLFCGITLSGSGETVLLLDGESVVDFCQRNPTVVSSQDDDELVSTTDERKSNTKRALVVDDSLTARKMLCKLLHDHDFTTVEVGDGIEAIEQLHRSQFDLVLTDLDMPRMGGLELLSDVQSGHYCDAPIVVVSSRDDETFRNKAMDRGAANYLTKPVSGKSISGMIANLQSKPVTSKGSE